MEQPVHWPGEIEKRQFGEPFLAVLVVTDQYVMAASRPGCSRCDHAQEHQECHWKQSNHSCGRRRSHYASSRLVKCINLAKTIHDRVIDCKVIPGKS